MRALSQIIRFIAAAILYASFITCHPSCFTGLPAVLGPMGHESQWRGGYNEMGSRNDDVKRIYETHSWETAKELLDKYDVRYVFVGSAEKSAYNIQDRKFERNLTKVYDSGNCVIYQVK